MLRPHLKHAVRGLARGLRAVAKLDALTAHAYGDAAANSSAPAGARELYDAREAEHALAQHHGHAAPRGLCFLLCPAPHLVTCACTCGGRWNDTAALIIACARWPARAHVAARQRACDDEHVCRSTLHTVYKAKMRFQDEVASCMHVRCIATASLYSCS